MIHYGAENCKQVSEAGGGETSIVESMHGFVYHAHNNVFFGVITTATKSIQI